MNQYTRTWQFISEDTAKYQLKRIGETASLDEASQGLENGVYTTFRTYQHDKVLRLEDHFDRLELSAKLKSYKLNLPRYILREGLREIIGLFKEDDVRLRIHCALEINTCSIYIMAEPFTPIEASLYDSGAKAETIQLQRENPQSKATSFIEATKEIRKTKPGEINEYLMVDKEGNLLEGMSSNIFVIKDHAVWTASQGILPGITRQVVLEVIAAAGIKIKYSGYPFAEINHADEVFITSASRGILPVTEICNQKIGTGFPGNITLKIKTDYEKWLQFELRQV